jgi:hypothetical protein
VAGTLFLTANTALAPGRYECRLLDRYAQGELTIDQVLELLDAATYQILYRSRATTSPTTADLWHLLDRAGAHNTVAGITGLLLYSSGRYVQVLEGPEDEVRAVYGCILRDPRHTQVRGLRTRPAMDNSSRLSRSLECIEPVTSMMIIGVCCRGCGPALG